MHRFLSVITAAVAAAIMRSGAIFYYLPVLLVAGVVFGVINGLLLKLVIKRTEKLFL